jgi:hypothetical protein
MPLTPRGRTAQEGSDKLQHTNGALAAPNGQTGQPDGSEGAADGAQTAATADSAQTGAPVESVHAAAAIEPAAAPAGFIARGRLRRRLSFLRKARELAYRDLGGLIYDLHRFGERRDELVLAKVATLSQIDDELRAIQDALGEGSSETVLREAGVAACARCGAVHSSADRFCPCCGLALGKTDPHSITGAPSGGAEDPGTAEQPPPGS